MLRIFFVGVRKWMKMSEGYPTAFLVEYGFWIYAVDGGLAYIISV